MEPGFTFVHISCSSIFNCRIFCYLHQQQKKQKEPRKKPEENTLSCRVIQSVRIRLHIIYTDRHLLRYY
jgi:predicted HicB family RNase H-like nuclease